MPLASINRDSAAAAPAEARPLAREPLFPESLKTPLILLALAVLPQLMLMLINVRAFSIASGEMTAAQKSTAHQIFAFEVLLVLGCAALAVVLQARRRPILWVWSWPLLLAPVGYLWLVTALLQGAIPATIADWILPRGELLYYQYALVMPLVFYAGARLASAEVEVSRGWEVAWLAGIVVGLPVFLFVTLRLGPSLPVFHAVMGGVIVVLAVAMTLLVLGAYTRLCVIGYVELSRKGPRALAVFTFVVAIVLPVAGLLLNRHIPFPSDLQAWSVYGLALANGCVLLLPNFRHPRLHRLVWLAQCACFPFTLYFFLIFLPYLPLSLPAMLYMGAGFLVLTPTALFLLHTQRLVDGFRHETQHARRLPLALLATAMFAILPASYVAEALLDRSVLRHAIDHVYSPDYRGADRFDRGRAAVARSLERLRDRKAGLNLPFLSDFYSWAVFNNLILPDEKMNAIHQAFFGTDLPAVDMASMGIFGAGAMPARALREARPVALPPQDVALVNLSAATVREGGAQRTTFTLDLENRAATQSEYVTRVEIPEGAFVSGYWLKVGEERVPGRIFEKKTAHWVYHMIRDWTRRDPGILTYIDSRTLELRVFPFAAHERRRTEIELLYPAELNLSVKIGTQEWRAESSTTPGIALVVTGEGTSAVSVAAEALAQLPPTARLPYLHFIVDRSAAAGMTEEQTVRAMRNAGARVPGARECLVTSANYESADLVPELTRLDAVEPAVLEERSTLPRRGGFLAERAMKRALLGYYDRLQDRASASAWQESFPVVVLVSDRGTDFAFDPDIARFAAFAPDNDFFYVANSAGEVRAFEFTGKESVEAKEFHPVALLQLGGAVSPIRLDAAEPQLCLFEKPTHGETLQVYRDARFEPFTPASIFPADAPYSRAADAWQRYLRFVYDPSLGTAGLTAVVQASRATGVLTPLTSYIVVENTAQWRMLERKERQKLGGPNALEFEEVQVPESGPTAFYLVVATVVLFVVHRRWFAKTRLTPRTHKRTLAHP